MGVHFRGLHRVGYVHEIISHIGQDFFFLTHGAKVNPGGWSMGEGGRGLARAGVGDSLEMGISNCGGSCHYRVSSSGLVDGPSC